LIFGLIIAGALGFFLARMKFKKFQKNLDKIINTNNEADRLIKLKNDQDNAINDRLSVYEKRKAELLKKGESELYDVRPNNKPKNDLPELPKEQTKDNSNKSDAIWEE
jgi:hypothetical protein